MKTIHFDSIDSTNTYLKNNYLDLENLTFVSAGNQTQGKGRNNRKWDSDGSNLLFSILIKDNKYFPLTNSISIISAYTIIEVLKSYGINDLSIKWPNDVFVKDNKICGILLESISKENLECLIIGIGLNVNQNKFDDEYIINPTSMYNILKTNIDIESLKQKIYSKFIMNLEKLIEGYDYYNEIINYDYLQNKEVYALINSQKELVKVKGINSDYSLCVANDESEFNINAGEISFHI